MGPVGPIFGMKGFRHQKSYPNILHIRWLPSMVLLKGCETKSRRPISLGGFAHGFPSDFCSKRPKVLETFAYLQNRQFFRRIFDSFFF